MVNPPTSLTPWDSAVISEKSVIFREVVTSVYVPQKAKMNFFLIFFSDRMERLDSEED